MTISRPLSSAEAKIRSVMLQQLEAAPRPLTFRQLKHAYEVADGPDAADELFRNIITLCVTAGAIYPASGSRYWNKDEKALYVKKAQTLIKTKPRTKAELVRLLEDLELGASKTWREGLFEELKKRPDIHVHPVLGNPQSLKLATEPPQLNDFIAKAKQEYSKAFEALTSAGYTENDIVKAITGVDLEALRKPSPNGQEPTKSLFPAREDDDLDFQRDASELLVYAWQDAGSHEAREVIEDTLYQLGLEPIGAAGSVMDFDGRLQHTDTQLNGDTKVKVLQPGWELRNARGAHLIAKAKVEPVLSA